MSRNAWSLMRRETNEVVVRDLRVADGFFSRFAGLQFRRKLPRDAGLLLVPQKSIHTVGVLFSLDVVMLDRMGTVLEVRRRVPPFRAVIAPKGTHAILEMTAEACPLVANERLQIVARQEEAARSLPRSLQFLLC